MAVRWGRLYEGTPAELALEDAVAEVGVPYRTQFPGWKYGLRCFPDFVLPTLKLVIEVDDRSHERKREEDEERTRDIAAEWGYRVVRCTNENALSDPRGTVRALLKSVGMWPLPANLPRVRDSLPPLKRAPQRLKREAKSAARRARRQESSGRSSPGPKRFQSRRSALLHIPQGLVPPPPQVQVP